MPFSQLNIKTLVVLACLLPLVAAAPFSTSATPTIVQSFTTSTTSTAPTNTDSPSPGDMTPGQLRSTMLITSAFFLVFVISCLRYARWISFDPLWKAVEWLYGTFRPFVENLSSFRCDARLQSISAGIIDANDTSHTQGGDASASTQARSHPLQPMHGTQPAPGGAAGARGSASSTG
ncbi:hypothetical protein BJV74DRAFT_865961 [Russula compacta]|nr:hypothetical protein BJV74DRAFT_865961 [Russula compacta]